MKYVTLVVLLITLNIHFLLGSNQLLLLPIKYHLISPIQSLLDASSTGITQLTTVREEKPTSFGST